MSVKLSRRLRELVKRALGMESGAGRSPTWAGYTRDARQRAEVIECTREDLAGPQQHPERVAADPARQSANWYLPPFDNPYYGGVMTILRFAAHLRAQGVRQRFLICGHADTKRLRAALVEAFPTLADSEIGALDSVAALAAIPPADLSFATLWTTAYVLLRVRNTGLKFYFMQDYEPLFYPAGSTYAQAELTYRFGFIGLANTSAIRDLYEQDYGGRAHAITPCIDPAVFFPASEPRPAAPRLLFYYARPGTPRNGFELAAAALRRLKQRLGNDVRIVCAGATWEPADYGLSDMVEPLGLLSYRDTGDLYRRCHVGFVMMMTRHPSYLPFELMGCGSLVVTNRNPASAWFLRDRENCLLAPASATALAETLDDALRNWESHAPIRERATHEIMQRHSDWGREMSAAFAFVQQQTG
jgi:glycosyltransferase involved in cell wall biosynthesis